jgi:hypothetical protein
MAPAGAGSACSRRSAAARGDQQAIHVAGVAQPFDRAFVHPDLHRRHRTGGKMAGAWSPAGGQ